MPYNIYFKTFEGTETNIFFNVGDETGSLSRIDYVKCFNVVIGLYMHISIVHIITQNQRTYIILINIVMLQYVVVLTLYT